MSKTLENDATLVRARLEATLEALIAQYGEYVFKLPAWGIIRCHESILDMRE